jgi:hypothetical protein
MQEQGPAERLTVSAAISKPRILWQAPEARRRRRTTSYNTMLLRAQPSGYDEL